MKGLLPLLRVAGLQGEVDWSAQPDSEGKGPFSHSLKGLQGGSYVFRWKRQGNGGCAVTLWVTCHAGQRELWGILGSNFGDKKTLGGFPTLD